MKPQHFHTLLLELIDENPFAIRAVLKILEVQFTDAIPTLAVTIESTPRLLVNLLFIEEYCHTESQIKAVIVHEFLHVLLRHTEEQQRMTPARHLAFDAVINAIIHRQYGPEYSSMMSAYYADAKGLSKLLRPMTEYESNWHGDNAHPYGCYHPPQWVQVWDSLYQGSMIADDIEQLAIEFERSEQGEQQEHSEQGEDLSGNPFDFDFDFEDASASADIVGELLGNHDDFDDELSETLQNALDESMREMNGSGIWREPQSRGIGANPYQALFTGKDEPLLRWQKKTLKILKQYVQPDHNSRASERIPLEYRIPVLSAGDRRAFIRSLWSPFLPDASWNTLIEKPVGSTHIYLDVSGSMDAEMPLIITLLGKLSRYIRRPFWAFSNEVAPAVIEKGQLRTTTSGGTSMSCVLEHLAITRPVSAVVITDGYIERVAPALIAKTSSTVIHAIVTRDGSPAALRNAGISYTQLDRVPT